MFIKYCISLKGVKNQIYNLKKKIFKNRFLKFLKKDFIEPRFVLREVPTDVMWYTINLQLYFNTLCKGHYHSNTFVFDKHHKEENIKYSFLIV